VNVVPTPGVVRTTMPPWWLFMMPWTTARPRPVPLPAAFAVKNGSKMRSSVASLMPAPVSSTTGVYKGPDESTATPRRGTANAHARKRALRVPNLRTVLRYFSLVAFAALFVAGGVTHFLSPSFYVAIVPAYLPRPLVFVHVSGAFEILFGGALLVPRFRRLAAWGLVALLIAVFPANVQMALHHERYASWSVVLLWARLPVQGLLVAWAWSYTKQTGRPVGRPVH
jgi:uncharacterized membrane protein